MMEANLGRMQVGMASSVPSPLPDAMVLEEVTFLSDPLASWRALWNELSK